MLLHEMFRTCTNRALDLIDIFLRVYKACSKMSCLLAFLFASLCHYIFVCVFYKRLETGLKLCLKLLFLLCQC